MNRSRVVAAVSCVLAVVVAGCAAEDPACVPGESQACACPTGGMGAQSCARDGTGFGLCVCVGPMDDGGMPEDSGVPEDGGVQEDGGLPEDGGPPVGCGDGVCAAGESAVTCAADCPQRCGDTLCTGGESPMTCPGDCAGSCGDSTCVPPGESARTCPMDCPAACGDGACTHDETAMCAVDCPVRCGDGLCTHAETEATCAADCTAVCGDTMCSAISESCGSCSVDCGGCLPASIDVFVTGAVVRAWDNAEAPWDGSGVISALLKTYVNSQLALSGDPRIVIVNIAARVASEGLSVTAPPDVSGVAGISVDGVPYPALNVALPLANDAYQVEFAASGWTVPGASTLRVDVQLADEDVAFDDPIGTVNLTEEDLRAAWNEHPDGFHWIQVSDQMTAILFVRVRVSATP